MNNYKESLNLITDYLAALIRDGKIDAISINAEQMGEAIANLRCGEISDVKGLIWDALVYSQNEPGTAQDVTERIVDAIRPYLRTTEPVSKGDGDKTSPTEQPVELIEKLESLKWGEESEAGKGANAMLQSVLSVVHQHSTKRELVAPPPEMGVRMQDIRVGMKLKSLYGGPEVTVTELTEKGFTYKHPPYHLGSRIGQTEGGEHYGYNGYSHYTEIEDGATK
jgi:hypothetical protein